MNNLITNFDQILEFAFSMQVPTSKKRGIIREYLQTQFLIWLYGQPKAKDLCFTGDTSLRLLRGIPRFSEDLDFDNLGLTGEQIDSLIQQTTHQFEQINIPVSLAVTHRNKKNYYQLRFPDLLYDLKISTNPKEKLMIKIDYTSSWQGQKTEIKLLNHYGLLEQIITNPISQLLVQKLAAYLKRKQTQPRDIYDIVWLFAQGARPDRQFMTNNNLPDLLEKVKEKFDKEGIPQTFRRRRLEPFLLVPEEVKKLDLFGQVLSEIL